MRRFKILVPLGIAFPLLALGAGALKAQTSSGKPVSVTALTLESGAEYTNPTGAFEPVPSTSLAVGLKKTGAFVITFSAQGQVGTGGALMTIQCRIDGVPCPPTVNAGSVRYAFPTGTDVSDSRTFTWVAHQVATGPHIVSIHWNVSDGATGIVRERTLVVQGIERDVCRECSATP